MRGHFAYLKINADSAFFSHDDGQTIMNQNGRVNLFECLRPKLTIFEVKPSIHRLAYGTIARNYSTRKIIELFTLTSQITLLNLIQLSLIAIVLSQLKKRIKVKVNQSNFRIVMRYSLKHQARNQVMVKIVSSTLHMSIVISLTAQR